MARRYEAGSASNFQRELVRLLERYEAAGVVLTMSKRKGSQHWRIDTPRGAIFASSTPNRPWRALTNVKADLKRLGFPYPR